MKILVVEDDELVAQTLSTILAMYHYAVEVVHDGQSALDLLQAFEFDLVILDIFLPQLDGLEVCKRFRSMGKTTPILFLTARDSSQDKARGLDAGADDYLVKPFDPEELVARVRALLRRGTTTSESVLRAGELTLDPVSCEVAYQQELLALTPKEFALMELFLRNPKRVYSCGMILEHLWTHDDTPGEEAVRTHIKGLRQKLKVSGAGSDLVATVYGIGYRLNPQVAEDNANSVVTSKSNEVSSTPLKSFEQPPELQLQIDLIWQEHQDTLSEKINLIAESIEQAEAGTLSSQSREIAIRSAHSLAGSLGTFGLTEGSKVARSIEMSLLADSNSLVSDYDHLRQWVDELRQAIENHRKGQEAATESEVQEPGSILILVDEKELKESVSHQVSELGLQSYTSHFLDKAVTLALNIVPSSIVFCPTQETSLDALAALLEELRVSLPDVPLIGCITENESEIRLALEKLHLDYLVELRHVKEVINAAIEARQIKQSNATILAVDDDISILSLLKVLLKPWGINVHTVSSPTVFWEKLEEIQPDLVILDVEMPEQNGIELCQLLRNNAFWSELPILFLTVYGNENVINKIFQAGADDYIQKPFVGPELVTRIINRLERIRLLKRLTQSSLPDSSIDSPSEDLVEEAPQKRVPVLNGHSALLQQVNLNADSVLKTMNIADDAILFIDRSQTILFFNVGAENIFGYSSDEVLGQSLDILLPKRYLKRHRKHVQEFGQSKKSSKQMAERQEIFGLKKDGTEFPAEASIAALQEASQPIFSVILRDITERKREEERKDEFISMVSHELRTPLTSIHGSLQVLSQDSDNLSEDDKHKNLLGIAVNSTERLVRLVNNLLSVERINAGQVEMTFVQQNLAKIAQTAVDEMQAFAEGFDIALQVTTTSTKGWVDGDYILQLLTNLLSNAIRYSKPGDIVSLVLKKVDDEAEFLVSDQGRGIPEDKLQSIFQRFQQVDVSDHRDRNGTGLGLAICNSIVEQHHGKIWVESAYGVGSQFFVRLPLQPQETL